MSMSLRVVEDIKTYEIINELKDGKTNELGQIHNRTDDGRFVFKPDEYHMIFTVVELSYIIDKLSELNSQ